MHVKCWLAPTAVGRLAQHCRCWLVPIRGSLEPQGTLVGHLLLPKQPVFDPIAAAAALAPVPSLAGFEGVGRGRGWHALHGCTWPRESRLSRYAHAPHMHTEDIATRLSCWSSSRKALRQGRSYLAVGILAAPEPPILVQHHTRSHSSNHSECCC